MAVIEVLPSDLALSIHILGISNAAAKLVQTNQAHEGFRYPNQT